MFLNKAKVASLVVWLALVCCVCLSTHSLMEGGQDPPFEILPPVEQSESPATVPGVEDAKEPPAESPIALVHDFGKMLPGTPARHTFLFVNRSSKPLRILSVRGGG
jgi:hypothetical protein